MCITNLVVLSILNLIINIGIVISGVACISNTGLVPVALWAWGVPYMIIIPTLNAIGLEVIARYKSRLNMKLNYYTNCYLITTMFAIIVFAFWSVSVKAMLNEIKVYPYSLMWFICVNYYSLAEMFIMFLGMICLHCNRNYEDMQIIVDK